MELISDARLLAEAMADEIVRTDDELRDLRTITPIDLAPGVAVNPTEQFDTDFRLIDGASSY